MKAIDFKYKYYYKLIMSDEENKKRHKSISVTRETYEKLLEMGKMNISFNDLISDLINQANK